jgi:daunorubicin resistance ABC transporter ATP-binding subunit
VSSSAIVTENLVKTYKGDVRALDGVSLEVKAGTVLGLLGPNGAGKTTTVRVLTTLLQPDSGRAEVAGVDVVSQPDAVRRLIGLAGQSAAVDENLTGSENLQLVGKLNHMPKVEVRDRAAALLDRFGLADAGDRRAKTYSGGMRRRLDLAAALVARAPVLFLDEPTTGLDPRSRADLWAIIEELVDAGTTVLLTTQYLEEADRLADQICVIDHGKVIAEGTSAQLKSRLGATIIELRLANEQTAERAETALEQVGELPPVREGVTVRVTTSDGPASLPQVVSTLNEDAIPIAGLEVREPSLDDVFLALTGHHTEETEEQAK